MAGKLKAQGLALAAVLALGAATASAASAEYFHSGSTSGTTYFTATQIDHQIDTQGGNIKCNTITAKGQYWGTTTSEITLENLQYSNCMAFGMTADFDVMGCDYRIRSTSFPVLPVLNIACPTTAGGVTDEMTVTPTVGGMPACKVEIPEQELGAYLENIPAEWWEPDEVRVKPTALWSLKYTVTSTGLPGLPKCGPFGSYSNGQTTGAITLRAFEDSGHTDPVGFTNEWEL